MKKSVFLILSLAICLLLTVYAPLEIYASNIDDVDYDLYDMAGVQLVCFAACFAGLSVLSFCICGPGKGKLSKIWAGVLLFVLLDLLIQGTFFASKIPVLDGDSIEWSVFSAERTVSAAVFAITAAVVAFLAFRLKEESFSALCKVTGGVVTAFMIISSVLMCFSTENLTARKNVTVTDEYLLDMSDDENFVILILDGMESSRFARVAANHPEYSDYLEDFTFFSNTSGAYPFTKRAIPFIICGEWYEFGESQPEYFIRCFSESPLVMELYDRDYRIGMYEAEEVPHREVNLKYYENLECFESRLLVRPFQFAKLQFKLTGLKYLPWQLKPRCTVTPDQLEYDAEFANGHSRSFSYDNGFFYDKVMNEDISVGSRKCFRFIHVKGAHPPYDFNSNMERIEDGSFEDGIEASLTLTGAYLDKLKKAGVYDNSVIMIMADHGYSNRHNPVLFIKGRNEHHPLIESEAPVSHEDLQEAYRRLLDGCSSEDAFDWREGDGRTRRFLDYSIDDESIMYEMLLTENAQDKFALVPTGNTYTAKWISFF